MLKKPKSDKVTRVTFRDAHTGRSLTMTLYGCGHVEAHGNFVDAVIAKANGPKRPKRLPKIGSKNNVTTPIRRR